MRRITHYIYTSLAAVIMALAGVTTATAQTWDFATVGETDKNNLAADATNWLFDESNNRYKSVGARTAEPLKANGAELNVTKGLLFTCEVDDAIRVDFKKKSVTTNKTVTITIPGLKAGMEVMMTCQTSKSGTARGFNVTNLKPVSGAFNSTADGTQTNVGTVETDGDVTLTNTGGLYVYSLKVVDPSQPGTGDGNGGTGEGGSGDNGGEDNGQTPADDHSVQFSTTQNQARLTTRANEIKYYNTVSLAGIDIDKAAGTVTVIGNSGDWQDVYTRSVANISFSKATAGGSNGDISNVGVEITEAKGWNESAYVEWKLYEGATSYNVYVKGGNNATYTKLDKELVRNYGTYGRADAIGLKAGVGYAMKVVPVIGGAEDESKASEATNLTVAAYDRAGFAHHNNTGVGAYNDDGTLKANARVIYVTAATAKTVSLDVITGKNGKSETLTGMQAIINGYQKGLETRPLAVRLIGTVRDTDTDELLSSGEGLQIKGKNNTIAMNITLEGVGEDANIWGFGILLRNAVSVELRNFGIMLCIDDCVSLDTDNKYCWIHNLDLFYGNTGGDADQAKGDGTIDVKGDSQYITIAYNHFLDSGKSSLCGMKSESGPNYIDYHHNWFDHSDSRHPRVRTMTVHVWNNYYDGCSKYGVGSTMGSSVFVENNYFRHTKNPMLISKQGTDAKGDGTFSGENGGVIKSFGNIYAEKGTGSNYTPITHKDNATSFDCYEAATRDEKLPASVVVLVGGTSYNNFDTDAALMYKYTPLPALDVPAAVTGHYGAGRMNKGDFKWTFDNEKEDTNYGVITELKTALQNYKSTFVGWFE